MASKETGVQDFFGSQPNLDSVSGSLWIYLFVNW